MSTKISVELPVGFDLTITDLAALLTAALLTINAVARITKTRLNNPGLLKANIAMIFVVLCSVSVVYEAIDPLLGGRSLLNCLAHLLMVYAGWEISSSTAKMLHRFDQRSKRSVLVHPWIPLVAAVGTVVAYLVLDPGSSRGLEDYGQEAAYVAYWAATVAPLALGAIHLVPRMAKLAPLARDMNWVGATSLTLLWLSFLGVLVSLALFLGTAIWPDLYTLRETVVTSTLLMFTAAFLMATAALPRPKEKQSQRRRPARTHTEHQ